ncbi:tail protein [Pseudomonas phage vB_PpuM-NoPa]|uniref:Tail protein n=3 Tax=Tartuvirus TaxID=3424912 RepID=A0AAX4MYW4_9CAUD
MSFTFKVETRKLDSMIKRLDKLDGTQVDVGFFEEDAYGPENGNLPVAQVAYYNEYGTSLNPTRPFMQETFSEGINQKLLGKAMMKVFQSAIMNGRQVQRLLRELGSGAGDMLRDTILTYPGSNSAETIRRKGRNSPLRDTEFMLNSVKFQISKGSIR